MKRSLARGTSLIEAMVALTVLAIGASGALSTVIYASTSLGSASHVSQASMHAQSLLTALTALPFTAQGSTAASTSPNSVFTNTQPGNDADIADSSFLFAAAVVPPTAWDHANIEVVGSKWETTVTPLPAGYQRYWNIAPLSAGNGVTIAVVVRWKEGTGFRRTVLVGTRYAP